MTNAVILSIEEYNQMVKTDEEFHKKVKEMQESYEKTLEAHWERVVEMINEMTKTGNYMLIGSREKLDGILDKMYSKYYVYKLIKKEGK